MEAAKDGELRHVAIIMDGNGRWAQRRGLPRTAGHRQGIKAVRRVTEAALELGIPFLTLFAFSEENWGRPATEVQNIFALLELYLSSEAEELANRGIRLKIIGDRKRLPERCRLQIAEAERVTRFGRRLTLTVAVNYGGRSDLTAACQKLASRVEAGELTVEEISPERIDAALDTAFMPDPDVVIRTAGELRISNFLLWQMAYAELFFSPLAWPDFTGEHLAEAVRGFGARRRNFGGVPLPAKAEVNG